VIDGVFDGIESIVKNLAQAAKPTTAPATVTKAPAGTLESARELYMRGQYAPAGEAYRKLLDKREARVSAAIGLARTLSMTGKYTQALESLDKVKDDTAKDARWHVAMAEVLNEIGRYDDALRHAAAANELEPAWAPAIFVHARLLETLGQKTRATAVYKTMSRAVEADRYRRDARSLVALGRIMDRYAVLSGQRASEQASNILHNYLQEAYLKADRKYWPANVAAGTFLLSKHRPKSAGKEFDLALKLNPNLPEAYAGLGAIELSRWQFEKCLGFAGKALAIHPTHADALLLKATCMMQWRKFEQVPPIVEEVLKVNPNHLDALSLMAAVHVRLDEKDKAQPFIDRVHKINKSYYGLPLATGLFGAVSAIWRGRPVTWLPGLGAGGWLGTVFTWHGQIAFWTICGVLTVFRFFTYLDARIRREGWDVELKLRAEATYAGLAAVEARPQAPGDGRHGWPAG